MHKSELPIFYSPSTPHLIHSIGRRYFVHRLVVFNTKPSASWSGRAWGNSENRPCEPEYETHHYPAPLWPRGRPWLNSRRRNMVVWSWAKHKKWHDDHPETPHLAKRRRTA